MPGLNYKGTSKYQKLTEAMVKRTHFTETEIDRLADLHANLMVKIFYVQSTISVKQGRGCLSRMKEKEDVKDISF